MKQVYISPISVKINHIFKIKYVDKEGVIKNKSLMAISERVALSFVKDYSKIISITKN